MQDFAHRRPLSRLLELFIHGVSINNDLLIIDLASFVIFRLETCTWQAVCSSPTVCFPRSSDRFKIGLRQHFRATGLVLTQPEAALAPVAPRCDVTASNSTHKKPG